MPEPRTTRPAVLLGALSTFGALTIDMYLPAMPAMATQLRTTPALITLSLTVFVAGLAVGQVLVGPLSDAWGRRRPLVAGMASYLAGSLVCALAPTAAVLIGGRVLQSLGAAAATVLARAIARDLFDGPALARCFSTLMLVNGVVPVVAPVLGGQLLAVSSWRTVFAVQLVLAALLLVALAGLLPESLPAHRRRPAHLHGTATGFADLLGDRSYLGAVLTGGLMFGAVFTYISGSSFVLQDEFGLSAQQFSLVFGANGLGMVLVASLNGRLARFGERRLLTAELAVAVLGSAGVLAAAVLQLPPAVLLASIFAAVCPLGAVLANATTLALAAHGDAAGAASALQGLVQFLVAGLATAVLGTTAGSARDLGVLMLVMAGAALAVSRRR